LTLLFVVDRTILQEMNFEMLQRRKPIILGKNDTFSLLFPCKNGKPVFIWINSQGKNKIDLVIQNCSFVLLYSKDL